MLWLRGGYGRQCRSEGSQTSGNASGGGANGVRERKQRAQGFRRGDFGERLPEQPPPPQPLEQQGERATVGQPCARFGSNARTPASNIVGHTVKCRGGAPPHRDAQAVAHVRSAAAGSSSSGRGGGGNARLAPGNLLAQLCHWVEFEALAWPGQSRDNPPHATRVVLAGVLTCWLGNEGGQGASPRSGNPPSRARSLRSVVGRCTRSHAQARRSVPRRRQAVCNGGNVTSFSSPFASQSVVRPLTHG